jgi:uncharacterized protein YjbI with pentapeptide repeats
LGFFGIFSTATLLLIFTIATFPGEWLDANLPSSPLKFGGKSIYQLLVAGDVDLAARKPKSLWSNRLVIPGIDVLDHGKFETEEKIAALPVTVSLRARHLEGAVLIGANLRKADFTAAILKEANLSNADLREANFGCDRFGQDANCTQLQGANLKSANLEGATLDNVGLQGASLDYAQFQGASLKAAKLSGISAIQTKFHGALLDGADFGGSYLEATEFEVASLLGADFRGAYFYRVQFQGSDLNLANFNGSVLTRPFVWRVRSVPFADQRIAGNSPETGRKVFCPEKLEDCDWSFDLYSDFKARFGKKFSRDPRSLLSKIERLNPNSILDDEEASARAWTSLFINTKSRDEFDVIRSEELKRIGCVASGAPYIVRNLLKLSEVYFTGTPGDKLAAAFLYMLCLGALGLTEQEILKLRSMADRATISRP